ncbi:hypothetical protein ABD91_25750 [Lysinibacillus sphaericus]|uniref:hypothetical protein n=1 Tax=Lysinibacillus sphaericus TaxID=1421 RepID=UPI0018CD4A6D|nr:hypothetical protein [Lysinibacillus sphaericus]MBG9694144.1 hypothetical protein [Lysinibacillus sphaericus]
MKDRLKQAFSKPSFIPILFIIIIIFGCLSVGAFFVLKNSTGNPDIENGAVLKGNTVDGVTEDKRVKESKEVAEEKIDKMNQSSEVVVKNQETPLNNPISNEDFEMEEDEWEYIKGEVNKLVDQYKFVEANELLNKRVVGLDLEKYEFGAELSELHMDINKLSFIETTYGVEVASNDVGAAVTPIISQYDPKRALLASLWLSVNVMTEAILNQESLVPIRDGVPVVAKIEDLKDVHYLREIKTTYGDVQAKMIDFKLDGYPLQAIIIGYQDGTYRVWKIMQEADGEAPYQNIKFWKAYLQQIAPKGSHLNEGTGHGHSSDDEGYIDDNDDADYQKYLKLQGKDK